MSLHGSGAGVRDSGLRLVIAGTLAVLIASCDGSPNLGPGIAARIEGRDIPYADFNQFLAETAGDSRELQTAAIASLFETFLEEELMFALALDRELLTASADRSIAPALLLDSVEGLAPDESEIERYYLEHSARYQRDERVRLQQMLVQEAGVLEIAHQLLEAGEAWSAVAIVMEREHGALVGSQGTLSRQEMPLQFVEPVFELGPGDYTQVLKAEYGYHLFLVEERFPAGLAPLSEVREHIASTISTQRSDQALARLLEEAKERYNVQVADRNLPFERSTQD